MCWNRNSLLLAGALLTVAGSAIAAPLVVRSSARAYPAGRPIPDGRLVLGAADRVTILDARGTRTFDGPGSFDTAAPSATGGAATTLATLISQPTARRARVGAVRAVGGGGPRSPNLWYVAATRSGPHCIADTAKVTLWRPDMTVEQSYVIAGGGRRETIGWRRGQSARDWPATLPVRAGIDYSITAEGQAASTTIRFVMLPAGDQAPDSLAARLVAAGCTAQFDLLVATAAAIADAGRPAG